MLRQNLFRSPPCHNERKKSRFVPLSLNAQQKLATVEFRFAFLSVSQTLLCSDELNTSKQFSMRAKLIQLCYASSWRWLLVPWSFRNIMLLALNWPFELKRTLQPLSATFHSRPVCWQNRSLTFSANSRRQPETESYEKVTLGSLTETANLNQNSPGQRTSSQFACFANSSTDLLSPLDPHWTLNVHMPAHELLAIDLSHTWLQLNVSECCKIKVLSFQPHTLF